MTDKILFGNKKARNVAISTIAVVGVTIVLGILIFNGKKDGNSTLRNLPSEARGAIIDEPPDIRDADKDLTPEYQEMMSKVNRDAVDISEKKGQSGIERQNPVQLEDRPKTLVNPASTTQQTAQVPYEAQPLPKDSSIVMETATNAISALVNKWTPGSHQIIVYSEAPQSQQQSSAGSAAPAVGSGSQELLAATTPIAIIRAGDVHAITFNGMLNSDYPGPVVATLRTGPLAGSKLIGQMTRNKYRLAITFGSLIPADGGASIKVEASVIDAIDQLPGTATSVDKKIMERYVLRPFATFVSGMGQAIAASSSTTVMSAIGAQTTSNNINSSGQAKIAAGKVAEEFAKDLSGTAVEPTVVVDPTDSNSAAGILFTEDVYRIKANTSGSTTSSLQSSKSKAQQMPSSVSR